MVIFCKESALEKKKHIEVAIFCNESDINQASEKQPDRAHTAETFLNSVDTLCFYVANLDYTYHFVIHIGIRWKIDLKVKLHDTCT